MRIGVMMMLVFWVFFVVSCAPPKKESKTKTTTPKVIKGDVAGTGFDSGVEHSPKSYQKKDKIVKSDRLDEIFRISCVNGDRSTVIDLIQKGVNVNSRDQNGDTPLHLAVYYNNVEIVKILVRYGANPRIKNKQGLSPIDIAREKGYDEIYRVLVRN